MWRWKWAERWPRGELPLVARGSPAAAAAMAAVAPWWRCNGRVARPRPGRRDRGLHPPCSAVSAAPAARGQPQRAGRRPRWSGQRKERSGAEEVQREERSGGGTAGGERREPRSGGEEREGGAEGGRGGENRGNASFTSLFEASGNAVRGRFPLTCGRTGTCSRVVTRVNVTWAAGATRAAHVTRHMPPPPPLSPLRLPLRPPRLLALLRPRQPRRPSPPPLSPPPLSLATTSHGAPFGAADVRGDGRRWCNPLTPPHPPRPS